jgi:glycosyltransferase involved in cell wall biosynthesis
MKIVVIGPKGGYGGLEIHTEELNSFLLANSHSILRINVYPQPSDSLGKAKKLAFWAASCARVRAFRPDMVICVGIGHGYSWVASLSGDTAYRVQQVVTDEVCSNHERNQVILSPFTAIATQTPTLKKAVAAAFGSEPPVGVVPCFHQIQERPSGDTQIIPAGEQICLAYFGRLAKNKGLPLLLEAIGNIASPFLKGLDIWGSGPMQQELEMLIRDNPVIRARASLKGPYPQGEEYIRLLSSYHGIVLPSQSCEGLPLVLIEAASAGLPILTTRIGGIPDFAGGNPDVMTMDLGLPPLCVALKDFLAQIHNGCFQRSRQQAYFARYYSRTAIEDSWRQMLADPHSYFTSSCGISSPSLDM